MDLSMVPASIYSLPDLAQFLNRGFEDYFVPIQFNTDTFLNMLRKDGIDLSASRVLMRNNQPCGIALIARRGWTSRLAAMAVAKESRGKGIGSWFMKETIKEAGRRGEHEMVLEVIEQNGPAVKLYRNCGFKNVRRLVGFIHQDTEDGEKGDLYEIDLRKIAGVISQHGLSDLPWQLSGESIAQMNPPARAYCKGPAYVVISNPDVEHVVIWSLLVEPTARGHGLGTDMLKQVMANHVSKKWHVPAIFPEEFSKVFERAGFEKEELSQWQMQLIL